MPEAGPPLLEFRGVNTHYGDLHVLKDVNYSIAEGEIVCAAGRQRLRQVDHHEDDHGRRAAHDGRRAVRRRADRAGAHQRPRRPRHLPGAGGPAAVRAHDRVREPGDGRLCPQARPGLRPVLRRRPGAGLRLVPAGEGAAGAGRRHAVGRGAADGGDRPRPDGPPPPDLHGRAVDGAVAACTWSRCSTSSRRSTARGRRSSWWSRTRPWRCTIAHRAYVLQTGVVVLSGTAAEMRRNQDIRHAYLGEMQVAPA